LKKSQSETFASLASDTLPFIEYELHRRLHIKVKVTRYQNMLILS